VYPDQVGETLRDWVRIGLTHYPTASMRKKVGTTSKDLKEFERLSVATGADDGEPKPKPTVWDKIAGFFQAILESISP
jgi:hypothetical protein